jgi:hypothetical protein
MKRIAIIITAVAATLFVGAAAGATFTRIFNLRTGDTAASLGGDTQCRVVRLNGVPGFRCFVGGDYRAKYGILIGSQQVAITQYSGFDSYRVIARKRQSQVAP